MNAIFQMLNPSNTLTVNRLLAHAIGLSEAVIYARPHIEMQLLRA